MPVSTSLTPTHTLYIRAGVTDASASNASTIAPPITSIGCLAVWFALALEGRASSLRIVECAWETSSPSGSLPCLERARGDATELVGALGTGGGGKTGKTGKTGKMGERALTNRQECCARDDMVAAEAIFDALFGSPMSASAGSLDGAGSAAVTTADLALHALVSSNILPGVSASLWGDASCYEVLAASVYGGRLPWPLKWWLPRGVRRCAVGADGSGGGEHVQGDTVEMARDVHVLRAVEALDALCVSIHSEDEKMSVRTRSLLAAVCTTVRCFPVCEAIRASARGLDAWLDGVIRDVVVCGKVGRGMPPALADAKWAGVRVVDGHASEGHAGGHGDEGEDGEEDGGMDRTSTYWLVGIGALATLYAAMLLRESVDIQVVDVHERGV